MFTKVAIISAFIAASQAAIANVTGEYITSTATEIETSATLVTITSCADNKCTEIPVTTGVTVVTVTSSGVETLYTTYCPLTASSSAAAVSSAAPTVEVSSSSVANITAPAVSQQSSAGGNKLVGAGLAGIAGVAGALLL